MSSEHDRMLKGEMYNSKEAHLCELRSLARKRMAAFDDAADGDPQTIEQCLKDLLGGIGENGWIESPLYVEYGKNTFVGNKTFLNFCCVILDVCKVTIGDYVLFAPGIQVYTATHPIGAAERLAERRSYGKPVEIGSDVWIGGRAIICPGVKIGEGSVIGAGSVVTRDIPPNSLGVGNPCRVIKELTEENCPKIIRTNNGSEKDRMLRGELYNALDPQLTEERLQSRKLQKAFNSTKEDEQEKRKEIVKELFGSIGENTLVEPPFYCDYGRHTTLGKNVHIYANCCILDVCRVTIGDNTILEHSVQLYPATHPLSALDRRTGLELGKPINVGADVFIGNGAILCPGVSIGDGSVIAAGSVVTRDIPPNVLAAGNPCRVIEDISKTAK